MTHDEAVALWKTQNPQPVYVYDDGEQRALTDEEYEQMAQHRADLLMEQEERTAADDANTQESQGILDDAQWLEDTAVNLRDTTKTMTIQQVRNVIAHGFDIQAHVIRYLHKQRNQPAPAPTGGP